MLRITKPRLEVLDALYRVGGRVHQPEGRATAKIAGGLGYSGSLTGLKRVLAALDEHGLIDREARDGRVHTITLTAAGEQLLQERGSVSVTPRQHLLDEMVCENRDLLALAASSIGQRLSDWAAEADIAKSPEDLRFESALAIHEDLAPRTPDPDELAVLVARVRVSLRNLLDTYLTEPSTVDDQLIEPALRSVLDARLALIAWHKQLAESDRVESA